MDRRSWEEFRNSGMLWWINTMLHTFGWAIVFEFDKYENTAEIYPARVKFRGFSEDINTSGYKAISKYLSENIEEIKKEADE